MKRISHARAGYLLLCALLPAALMLLVLALLQIVPFGENTLLFGDAYGQYRAFFSQYSDLFTEGVAGLYTLHKALGGELLSLAGYYLFSPLNLLLLLFAPQSMGLAFSVLYLLKTALAGLTMGLLVQKRSGAAGLPQAACAAAWALCGYMVGFSQNIMWLDALILLPLMVLGIDRILQGGRVWLYLFSLSAAVLFCYYTGFMLCIFSVLYLLARLAGAPHPRFALRRYAAASLIAGGLQAWLWLTSYLALSEGKAEAAFQFGGQTDFTFLQFLRLLLPASWTGEATNNSLPLVYCGAVCVGLAVLWFAGRRPLRQKLAAAGLLGALYLSLWLHSLGLCWQGFQEPTWFGWRFSFLFSFVVLDLAARALPALPRRGAVVLALVLCAELTYNAHATFSQWGPQPDPSVESITAAQTLLAQREDADARTESTVNLSQNDPFLLDYYGLTHFSSSYSQDVLTFLRSMGYTVTSGWSRYGAGSTLAADSLLGVRYRLATAEDDRYATVAEEGGLLLQQNEYALPLGFACAATSNGKIDRAWPLYNTNQFYSELLGQEAGVLTRQPASSRLVNLSAVDDYTYAVVDAAQSGAIEYTVSVQSDGALYANFPVHTSYGGAVVTVDGQQVGSVLTEDANGVLYLGQVQAGQEVTVLLISQSATLSVGAQEFWLEDETALAQAAAQLREGGLQTESQREAVLAGSFTAGEDDGEFLLTLPYDSGLRVYVDGQRVSTRRAFGALTAFDVSPGTHTLRVTYWPAGLTLGLTLSALSALTLAVWLAAERRKKRQAR